MTAPSLLGERGQVYVTLAAAHAYAEHNRAEGSGALLNEEARRELTDLLLDAHVQDEGPPLRCRARSRSTQLDLTARVVLEGRLYVVVAVNVRRYL